MQIDYNYNNIQNKKGQLILTLIFLNLNIFSVIIKSVYFLFFFMHICITIYISKYLNYLLHKCTFVFIFIFILFLFYFYFILFYFNNNPTIS